MANKRIPLHHSNGHKHGSATKARNTVHSDGVLRGGFGLFGKFIVHERHPGDNDFVWGRCTIHKDELVHGDSGLCKFVDFVSSFFTSAHDVCYTMLAHFLQTTPGGGREEGGRRGGE
jgi:hypothetical protein